ncbi:unnamed protein product [Strongylus vulgaris]|uniref:Uncharacterized protein n=1 Tax=Strongylus vulgaris TaxID=40348 RepID=A0A3P7JGV4_STRVU|nr:unnamed protein product [Strongylus vulgaris]
MCSSTSSSDDEDSQARLFRAKTEKLFSGKVLHRMVSNLKLGPVTVSTFSSCFSLGKTNRIMRESTSKGLMRAEERGAHNKDKVIHRRLETVNGRSLCTNAQRTELKTHKRIVLSSSEDDEDAVPLLHNNGGKVERKDQKQGKMDNTLWSKSAKLHTSASENSEIGSVKEYGSYGVFNKRQLESEANGEGAPISSSIKKETSDSMSVNGKSEGSMIGKDEDPWSGFKYVRRECDGFQKGYKVVKVSVVTKHPITNDIVGIVVFAHPDGEEFAQYIPLREIHENAPAVRCNS